MIFRDNIGSLILRIKNIEIFALADGGFRLTVRREGSGEVESHLLPGLKVKLERVFKD